MGIRRPFALGGPPKDAEILIHALGDASAMRTSACSRRARRARVPAIVVAAGRTVPATDSRTCSPRTSSGPGRAQGFPLDAIARGDRVEARRGGDLARCDGCRCCVRRPFSELIVISRRKNGIVGAAVFIPGADMPVLTLNQLRMVLRICGAYGLDADRDRAAGVSPPSEQASGSGRSRASCSTSSRSRAGP